jgi:hypothetical protein
MPEAGILPVPNRGGGKYVSVTLFHKVKPVFLTEEEAQDFQMPSLDFFR